jgi:hypothetical protein
MNGRIADPEELKYFMWKYRHGLSRGFQDILSQEILSRIRLDRHNLSLMASQQTTFHLMEEFGGFPKFLELFLAHVYSPVLIF